MKDAQALLESPARADKTATMKALVYLGAGRHAWADKQRPAIRRATDAIVRVTTTTICGTDLHILAGDVRSVREGRVLGHEGVGIVEEVGASVSSFRKGDRVLISCITACGRCDACRSAMPSHCRDGGWILGNTIDGTQAELVRIPHADASLHLLAQDADEEQLVLLSDVFPTGYECGVRCGDVRPGQSVAIVGAGPIGLAALVTAQLHSPAEIAMVDLDPSRLKVAHSLGATALVAGGDEHAVNKLMDISDGAGFDVVIEAVGVPASFELCQSVVAAGGRIAVVGVHGRPAPLHLERLWSHNVTLTTRLVDTVTTPLLLKLVGSGRLQPGSLITHRFRLSEAMRAYDTFANAARERALKVILRR
jgi:alcohol dehydrogenase